MRYYQRNMLCQFYPFSRRQKDYAQLKIPILGHVICTFLGIPFIISAGPPKSGWFWVIPMGAVGAGLSFILYTAVIKRLKAIEVIIIQLSNLFLILFGYIWRLVKSRDPELYREGGWLHFRQLPCMRSYDSEQIRSGPNNQSNIFNVLLDLKEYKNGICI